MKNKIIIYMILGLILTGCGSKTVLPYEENFSCEKGANSGICSRTSTIYNLDDNAQVKHTIDANVSISIDTNNTSTKISYDTLPKRSSEKFAKTYIFPYKDKDGDLHSSKIILIKIKDGDWEDTNFFEHNKNIRGIDEYNQ